ncbi:MAG TPA: hypothetical protein DDW45_05290 [Gammaproteobacteria bacterium]|nr:hypothetical protein [Gammaproteobacteria bacterium]
MSDAVEAAALLMQPSGATLDQVVAAMVLLNPDVFEHGDLQHVAFSRPLNIPSTEEILREDPDGLAQLLLQLDIVAQAPSSPEFADAAEPSQAVKQQQGEAAAPHEVAQESMAAAQTPAAEGSFSSSMVLIGGSAALLLISLMWVLFRFGRSRERQPLPAGNNAAGVEESSALETMHDDQRMLQLDRLPDDYLNYDDIEVLLQRVVAESADASRQVLQLMRFFRLQQDAEGFLRQHQNLLESGFYQRDAEIWSAINQDAVELGLQLNASTAAKEPVVSDERMQLQLDFGETNND